MPFMSPSKSLTLGAVRWRVVHYRSEHGPLPAQHSGGVEFILKGEYREPVRFNFPAQYSSRVAEIPLCRPGGRVVMAESPTDLLVASYDEIDKGSAI